MSEPVHACLWSSQPDLLIACDHSWATPAWKQPEGLPADVYATDDGRLYTFDEPLATCESCVATLADPEKRRRAGTP